MPSKKLVADLLFAVQAICAVIFGGAQFLRMLTTTEGVSVTWFVFWEAFLVLNLLMGWKAHQKQPSRVTLQTLWSYIIWTTVVTADLIVMIVKSKWDQNDTDTTLVIGVGSILWFAIAYFKQLSLRDPIIKAGLAVLFKMIPQLTLGYKIFLDGGAGLSGVTLINGHVTVLMRIGQLLFSIREAGWDRNRIGSAISEAANELSWVVVTLIWLYRLWYPAAL